MIVIVVDATIPPVAFVQIARMKNKMFSVLDTIGNTPLIKIDNVTLNWRVLIPVAA